MTDQQHKKELRSFGLIVGSVFLGIGLWPLVWQGAAIRSWAVIIGALLSVLGGVAPGLLHPIHKGWMFIGHVMGWINTRIILGFFFYVILTPMGLIARLMGKDFMHLETGTNADTYRILREPRANTHFTRQF